MAFCGFDDLNQFFDFDQLDSDHGAQAANQLEDAMAIDWAAGGPALLPASDARLPHDLHMQNALEDIHIDERTQRPLADVSYHCAMSTHAGIDAFHDITASSSTHNQPSLPEGPPSSSFLPSEAKAHTSETYGTDHVNLFDFTSGTCSAELDVLSLPTTAPPVSDTTISSRTIPPAPLRQPSTASWKPASARRKGPQSRIPLEARQILEDEFAANPYPCSWEMDIIAHQANLEVKKVRNWFNNTRARKKGAGEIQLLVILVANAN